MIDDKTPIIIGVGQVVERLAQPDYRALSPADLAAAAGRAAVVDAVGNDELLSRLDGLGVTRTVEDSVPMPTAFGKPDKFPRAVAKRLGANPVVAILAKAGGTTPLSLIAELGDRLQTGEIKYALALGAEAISTARHLQKQGEHREWSETNEGAVEDHGRGLAQMTSRYSQSHRLIGAPASYALLEHARRRRLGLSRTEYAREMGRLFSPFTKIAATNPYSSSVVEPMTAGDIIAVDERNRMVADPYPVRLVSRDQVNLAAAILMTTVGEAKAMGVTSDKWIFVHSCAVALEPQLIERPDLGVSPAAQATLNHVLEETDKSIDEIAYFDFYSCFPIPVFCAAVDVLGLEPDDPRGLTVTGGLPYFGGPGNNYSMHALAEMSMRLRADKGAFGLVGANGGILSKYGAATLSTTPAQWRGCDMTELQAQLDKTPKADIIHRTEGWARILTYTVVYSKGAPAYSVVIGELEEGGARFYANNADAGTLALMLENDPLGELIYVRSTGPGNRYAFDQQTINQYCPKTKPAFRDAYEHVLIERRAPVLEITINRPDMRNSLTPQSHEELASIIDAYEADPDLWVAIITGAGGSAFCAGNDLKYSASGKPVYIPSSGFGGLTTRNDRTKPVIAAVNGFAYGGGMEICLACDLVVADESAKFALPEVKVGLFAGAGGAVRLPRQIPRKLAMEMLLTGRPIDAVEAKEMGFVNRITSAGEVMAEARALADAIAANSPTSVRLTIRAVREAEAYASADDATAAAAHSALIDELMFSEDAMEGMMSFAMKRSPKWKNR